MKSRVSVQLGQPLKVNAIAEELPFCSGDQALTTGVAERAGNSFRLNTKNVTRKCACTCVHSHTKDVVQGHMRTKEHADKRHIQTYTLTGMHTHMYVCIYTHIHAKKKKRKMMRKKRS